MIFLVPCVASAFLNDFLRGGMSTPTLSAANLSATLQAWPGADVAVFFYSPYGEAGALARQFLPLWDDVARWHKRKNSKVRITKFSCDASLAHRQLCVDVGVKHYPTITFYGYGRLSLRRGNLKRSAEYRGLALPEALLDWTLMLSWISWLHRINDRFLQLFGLKPSPERIQLDALRRAEAERQRSYESLAAALDRMGDDDGDESSSSGEGLSVDVEKLLADALSSLTADTSTSTSSPSDNAAPTKKQ